MQRQKKGHKSPEDCEEFACKTKIDMFKQLQRTTTGTTTQSSRKKTKNLDKQGLIELYKEQQQKVLGASASTSTSTSGGSGGSPCPLDREELGVSTWGLLHTVAAYYPDRPSQVDCERGAQLVSSLAHLYPCSHCREDFQQETERSPPRLGSRRSFSLWLCEQHNAVNAKLGKPAFECTLERLDERWRTGSPACHASSEASGRETASESLGQ